jgi:hypothetical protein
LDMHKPSVEGVGRVLEVFLIWWCINPQASSGSP